MYREIFSLSDTEGNILRKNNAIGMLFSWLIEHQYFQENPSTALKLTEEHTSGFVLEVTKDTVSRDAVNAWNKYNHYK